MAEYGVLEMKRIGGGSYKSYDGSGSYKYKSYCSEIGRYELFKKGPSGWEEIGVINGAFNLLNTFERGNDIVKVAKLLVEKGFTHEDILATGRGELCFEAKIEPKLFENKNSCLEAQIREMIKRLK